MHGEWHLKKHCVKFTKKDFRILLVKVYCHSCFKTSQEPLERPGLPEPTRVLPDSPGWSQVMQDDSRWSQMTLDDLRADLSQKVPDDPRWLQMIPDDPRVFLMNTHEPRWPGILDASRCLRMILGDTRRSQVIPSDPKSSLKVVAATKSFSEEEGRYDSVFDE